MLHEELRLHTAHASQVATNRIEIVGLSYLQNSSENLIAV
jgi:hypothetical protein